MKRMLWTLLLALGMLLALCVGASAAEVSTKDALFAAAANGGEIKLTDNIEIDNTLTIKNETTLDLNGYVLKYESQNKDSVIAIEDGGVLTIKDSNTESVHYFEKESSGLWKWKGAGAAEGIEVKGGVITGGTGHPCLIGGGAYTNQIHILWRRGLYLQRAVDHDRRQHCRVPRLRQQRHSEG